jgi:hypothetical protein
MLWTILLGSIVVGLLLVLFDLYRKQKRLIDLAKFRDGLQFDNLAVGDRVHIISELANVQEKCTAWYEKSFSAIGVVAFFSMLIATGVQTLKSSVESAQAEQLKKEVQQLKDERTTIGTLLADISRSVEFQFRETGRLDRPGKEILSYRIKALQETGELNHDQLSELFVVAFALHDLETAKDAVDRNPNLLDKTVPADMLTLAEYDYLVGAPNAAKELIAKIDPRLSEMAGPLQVSVVVLDNLLYGDDESHVKQISEIEHISLAQAALRLTTAKRHFADAQIDKTF